MQAPCRFYEFSSCQTKSLFQLPVALARTGSNAWNNNKGSICCHPEKFLCVCVCWMQYFKVKTKLSWQCQSDDDSVELCDAFLHSMQIKASNYISTRMDSTLASSVSSLNLLSQWPCSLQQLKRWSLGCDLKAVFDEWNEKLSCVKLIFVIRLLRWLQRIIMAPAFQNCKNPSNLFLSCYSLSRTSRKR